MPDWADVTRLLIELLDRAQGHALLVERHPATPEDAALEARNTRVALLRLLTAVQAAYDEARADALEEHALTSAEIAEWRAANVQISATMRVLQALDVAVDLRRAAPVFGEITTLARHYLSAGPHGPGKGRPPIKPNPDKPRAAGAE